MACSTFSLAALLTCALSVSTRETVEVDNPDRLAKSRMVALMRLCEPPLELLV